MRARARESHLYRGNPRRPRFERRRVKPIARVRIAAVGDVHASEETRGTLRPHVQALAGRADVLLVAGDLTHYGTRPQAEALAAELEGAPVPVVAVLGNH